MMSQKQKTGNNSEAYQAEGDINIAKGPSADQISEIIVAVTGKMIQLSGEAKAEADRRMEDLKGEILDRVAGLEETVVETFREPDMQFALGSAMDGYARKGTPELREQLASLLLEKAKRDNTSRESSILSDAIGIAPKLTPEERSILVVLFVCKCLKFNAASIEDVVAKYGRILEGHTDNAPSNLAAFEYLDSLSCISINLVADHWPLVENVYKSYDQLPRFGNVSPNITENFVVTQNSDHRSASQYFAQEFGKSYPLKKLDAVWQQGRYRHSNLTAVGKAIAHGILHGQGRLNTPLETFLG